MSTVQGLAGDARSIDALKSAAARDPKAAVREVARQFEALFMQELMKSMRQATMESGMLDNEGTKLGRDLLDTQLSTQMTGLRGGLADAIARQLERQMGIVAQGTLPPGAAAAPAASAGQPASSAGPSLSMRRATDEAAATQPPATAQDFVVRHFDAARQAERATGIPAAFMVAQAAHETGWGRREIRLPDGASAHNLFGVKAGANWKGPVAEVATTEYIDGQPRKVVAKFRAYESYEAAFADYARLMKTSPRYAPVVANADTASGFAAGLQRAGYATDPAYADKLGRVINTTLRLQRALA